MTDANFYRNKAKAVNDKTRTTILAGIQEKIDKAASEGKFMTVYVAPIGVGATNLSHVIEFLNQGGFRVEYTAPTNQRDQDTLRIYWN